MGNDAKMLLALIILISILPSLAFPIIAKVEYALKKYQEQEITLGKAAEMAGVPLRKMLQIAANEGIPFQYSTKDLLHDFKAAK